MEWRGWKKKESRDPLGLKEKVLADEKIKRELIRERHLLLIFLGVFHVEKRRVKYLLHVIEEHGPRVG